MGEGQARRAWWVGEREYGDGDVAWQDGLRTFGGAGVYVPFLACSVWEC